MVIGKERHRVGLPLPQDVGDMFHYLECRRANIETDHVFIRFPDTRGRKSIPA